MLWTRLKSEISQAGANSHCCKLSLFRLSSQPPPFRHAAPLPANLNQHQRGKELDHHLPPAHRHNVAPLPQDSVAEPQSVRHSPSLPGSEQQASKKRRKNPLLVQISTRIRFHRHVCSLSWVPSFQLSVKLMSFGLLSFLTSVVLKSNPSITLLSISGTIFSTSNVEF